jgi:hypothetical protein
MADIFREVDEEVRQDQIQLWLARYWAWLLVAGLLIVAGTGGWRFYDYWRTQQEQAAGGNYLQALKLARDGKGQEALGLLDEVARTGTPGYRVLARFRAASQVGSSDAAAGAKAFDALASDSAVDPALRDLARLRAAALLLDTLDAAALKSRLEPLADTNSAFRNPARELLALAALKNNDGAAADRWLDAIVTDRGANQPQRQRAEALQALAHDAAPAATQGNAPPPAPAPPPGSAPATP